jgi:hypothetical protein
MVKKLEFLKIFMRKMKFFKTNLIYYLNPSGFLFETHFTLFVILLAIK